MFKFFFKKKALILIFIFGLVPLLWFKNDWLIAGGDFPIPLNPTGDFIKSFLYLWYPYLYGGEPHPHLFAVLPWFGFWSVFRTIGISLLNINKLWFVFVFILSGFSMYYLISVISNNKASPLFRFTGSIFYMFNVYVMLITPVMATPLLYGFLPLILGFYIKGLNNKGSFRYVVLIALALLFITSSVGNPPIYAIFGLMLFSYLVYHLLTTEKENLVGSFLFTFKIVFLYFLINLWWLYPYVNDILLRSNEIKQLTPLISLGDSLLSDNFRLLGSWAFYSGYKGALYFPFALSYKTIPLIILTFIIPVLAFSSALFKSKNKYIRYFLLMSVVGIFLAHGGNNSLYLLINSLPGFWIFREPYAKFTAITAISFAVLIGFSTDSIYEYLKSRFGNKKWHYFYPGLVITVILISSWPILTGDLIVGQRGVMKSMHVQFPDYWFKATEWINSQIGDFRVLVLPGSPLNYSLPYRWGYSSADVSPFLIHQPLIEEKAGLGSANKSQLSEDLSQTLYNYFHKNIKMYDYTAGIKRLMSLLNIKYLLQRNDVDNDYLDEKNYYYSPEHMKLKLSSQKEFLPEKTFGELDFYKINNEDFLPHFYIPEKIIEVVGSKQGLIDAVCLNNISAPGFYLTGSGDQSLREKGDEIFVEGENIDYSVLDKEDNNVSYSKFVKKPANFSAKLTSILDRENLVIEKLLYGNKIIIDIAEPFLQGSSGKASQPLVKEYQDNTNEIISLINEVTEKKDRVRLALKARNFLESNHDEIVKFITGNPEKRKELVKYQKEIEILIMKLEKLIPQANINEKNYEFILPEKGNYDLLMDEPRILSSRGLSDWQLEVGDKQFIPKEIVKQENGLVNLGSLNFNIGKSKLKIKFNNLPNVLADSSWQVVSVDQNGNQGGGGQEKINLFYKSIIDWQSNLWYQVSGDFKTDQAMVKIMIEERVKELIKDKTTTINQFSEGMILPPSTENHFELYIKGNSEAVSARLILLSENKLESSQTIGLKVTNLKIIPVFKPRLLLKSTVETNDSLLIKNHRELPKITFIRVNPTKYRVKVEGAKKPYTLVFSETFDKNWQLYFNQHPKEENYGSNLKSYLNGQIEENKPQSIFLDRNTSENWTKKPIADNRHFLINGYANSWYVLPQDVSGRENYELVVEYFPQRFYYLCLFISGLTVLSSIIYLIINDVNNKRMVG